MNDAFVSYSRKNTEFARRLAAALQADEREIWVDWEDIPWAEQWRKEIEEGIENANNFIFIVSEHSLASEVCNFELEYARQQKKRIIPIIRQDIDSGVLSTLKEQWLGQDWETTANTNWTELGHINWIFAQADDRFDEMFNQVIEAIEADNQHTKQHTRLQVRALEWQRADENRSFLLTGDEITSAEDWLISADHKTPAPSDLQRRYIQQSRVAEQRRQEEAERAEKNISIFRRSAAILLVSVIVVGGLAFYVWQLFGTARTEGEILANASTIEAIRQDRIEALINVSIPIEATQLPQSDADFLATETQIAILSAWEVTETSDNAVDMVYVPAGCFWMGSSIQNDEGGRGEVCVDAFWIDTYEVSVGQFDELDGTSDYPSPWVDLMLPRTDISWEDAQSFCEKRGTRLPTEEEWEYAARGASSLRYPYGNDFNADNSYAAPDNNEPTAVDSYPQGVSWVGAYHMSGNAAEWVFDIYAPYSQVADSNDFAEGDRVYRGGSYRSSEPHGLSSSNRSVGAQNDDSGISADLLIGFRCAMSTD